MGGGFGFRVSLNGGVGGFGFRVSVKFGGVWDLGLVGLTLKGLDNRVSGCALHGL